MLIVNRQHHELLIAYYRNELSKLPEGYFSTYHNKKAVYIFRDPQDPKTTRSNKRRILLSSKEGQIYSKLVERSTIIKAKLDYLNSLWKMTYWQEPRDIQFPLKKRYNSILNKERFFNSSEMQNPILSNRPTLDYKDRKLRSKNELILCTELDNLGYEYKVEINLSPNEFTELFPDATFYVPEIEKPVSVEIDGAVDKESYLNKSENRKFNYLNNGFVEFKDIVFLRLTDATQFDAQRLSDLIAASIFCNMSDIIMPD